jgi:hypothetical protein
MVYIYILYLNTNIFQHTVLLSLLILNTKQLSFFTAISCIVFPRGSLPCSAVFEHPHIGSVIAPSGWFMWPRVEDNWLFVKSGKLAYSE